MDVGFGFDFNFEENVFIFYFQYVYVVDFFCFKVFFDGIFQGWFLDYFFLEFFYNGEYFVFGNVVVEVY